MSHKYSISDWEIMELYRKCRYQSKLLGLEAEQEALEKVRQKLENDFLINKDLYFLGLTAEALKYMVAKWASNWRKRMKWNQIWKFNRNFINTDFVPRFAALDCNSSALVHIQHAKEAKTSVLFNIKKPRNGLKDVWLSDRVLVDLADVEALKLGENVIYFRNWENKMKILNIHRGSEGVRVEAQLDWKWDPNNYEECKKMRFTQILNWLAVTARRPNRCPASASTLTIRLSPN